MARRHSPRSFPARPIDEVAALREEAAALLASNRLDEATLAFGALAWRAPWCLDAWRGLATTLQQLDCEPAAAMTAAVAGSLAAPTGASTEVTDRSASSAIPEVIQ